MGYVKDYIEASTADEFNWFFLDLFTQQDYMDSRTNSILWRLAYGPPIALENDEEYENFEEYEDLINNITPEDSAWLQAKIEAWENLIANIKLL